MKKLSLICLVVTSFFATQVLAGNLTVNGNLTVTTNLTAESISLGGVTQTSWPGALAQGYKHVIVPEGTNDLQRGSNLQAAYTTATTLNPTSSNRVVVLVPPGNYNLGGTDLTMNTSYVDLIGLVPAQMTSKQVFTDSTGRTRTKTIANVQCPVLIYASASAGTLVQNVDYVRIESVILFNTGSGAAYGASVSGTNTVLRHVSMSSMSAGEYAGQYVDCVGDFNAMASGTFIDCTGGDHSFGDGTATGTFIDCTGGDWSFGGRNWGDSEASGTFVGCVGGMGGFGGNGRADGGFVDCVAGDYSFGGGDGYDQDGNGAGGTFIDCVGGVNSFGGGDGGSLDDAAKLQHCKGGPDSFGGCGSSDDFNYNVGGTNTFLMCAKSADEHQRPAQRHRV